MKNIIVTRELGGAGGEILYVPVPARGNVHSVKVSCDANLVATGTVEVARGGDAVNLVTIPTGDSAAGTVTTGVPDTTNLGLIFDPDSTTVVNQVIKITDDATLLAGAGTLTVLIEYDDSAYVQADPSEI